MKKKRLVVGKNNTRKNLVMITVAFIIVIALYSVSSLISPQSEIDPEECRDAVIEATDFCIGDGLLRVTLKSEGKPINGITAKIVGEKSIQPFRYFKTVKQGNEGEFDITYNEDAVGSIQKIEIRPLVNENLNIFYCSSDHMVVLEGDIKTCE